MNLQLSQSHSRNNHRDAKHGRAVVQKEHEKVELTQPSLVMPDLAYKAAAKFYFLFKGVVLSAMQDGTSYSGSLWTLSTTSMGKYKAVSSTRPYYGSSTYQLLLELSPGLYPVIVCLRVAGILVAPLRSRAGSSASEAH